MASHIVVCPGMGPSAGDLQKVAADLRVVCFIVLECGRVVRFSYACHKAVTEYKEAKALGVDTVPVLFGPLSYLLLSKPAKGVTAFGFDLVRGTKTLDLIKGDFPEGKYLFAGVVDGRNIWANDLAASLSTLETLEGIVGKDKLVVSTSCSLLHTAVDLVNETKLDKEIKPWLTFPAQKVVEVNALAGQKDEVIFSGNAAALASRKPSPPVIYEAFPAFKFPRHRRATNIHTHMFHSNLIDIRAIPTQRLIPARMKEKLDKLSRFKCDHTWGPGQRCGGRKLFRIEETKGDRDPIDNTEDYLRYLPIELNEEIGTSPPAINRSPKTMRVKITVNSHEYIALIDTGSNLNFLHPRVAGNGGLKIIHDDPIEVRIADGSIMCSEGSCPEFKFVIQGGQFATEAYILQLDGCDVILGIQWLMGLGQINWDFSSLKMELTQGGKTIQIKGMDTEESEVGCSTDEKLLSVFREGVKYGAGIGPGRIPSTEEIADGINKMLAVLETIQVNPDGGLKTRKYTEVKPPLKLLRSQLVSAK